MTGRDSHNRRTSISGASMSGSSFTFSNNESIYHQAPADAWWMYQDSSTSAAPTNRTRASAASSLQKDPYYGPPPSVRSGHSQDNQSSAPRVPLPGSAPSGYSASPSSASTPSLSRYTGPDGRLYGTDSEGSSVSSLGLPALSAQLGLPPQAPSSAAGSSMRGGMPAYEASSSGSAPPAWLPQSVVSRYSSGPADNPSTSSRVPQPPLSRVMSDLGSSSSSGSFYSAGSWGLRPSESDVPPPSASPTSATFYSAQDSTSSPPPNGSRLAPAPHWLPPEIAERSSASFGGSNAASGPSPSQPSRLVEGDRRSTGNGSNGSGSTAPDPPLQAPSYGSTEPVTQYSTGMRWLDEYLDTLPSVASSSGTAWGGSHADPAPWVATGLGSNGSGNGSSGHLKLSSVASSSSTASTLSIPASMPPLETDSDHAASSGGAHAADAPSGSHVLSSSSVSTLSALSSSHGTARPAWVPPSVATASPSALERVPSAPSMLEPTATEASAQVRRFNDAYSTAESAIRGHWTRGGTYKHFKSTYSAARSEMSTNGSEDRDRLVDLLDRQKAFMKKEYGSKGSYSQTLDVSDVFNDKWEREARDGMYRWNRQERDALTGRERRSVASRMSGFARKAFRLPGKSRLGS